MSLIDRYKRSVEIFGDTVHQIGDDQWESPTPCSEWNVRQLVNHIVYEDRWAVPLLAGKTIEDVGDSLDGDLLGDDPKGAWDSAAVAAVAAVEADDDLDRKVHVSWGQIPASDYLGQLFADHVIHRWDLARAIGVDDTIDPEHAELVYKGSKPQEDQLKSTGAFGDKIETPDDADLQTKLLAVFGRRT